jgi:RHS repeat-associated protein
MIARAVRIGAPVLGPFSVCVHNDVTRVVSCLSAEAGRGSRRARGALRGLRGHVANLCLALVIAALVSDVAAGQLGKRPNNGAGGGGGTPVPAPTITFSNQATPDTLFSFPETIRICSATTIPSSSASFNGKAITNFQPDTGSNQCVKSTATYTLIVGPNTFAVNACSGGIAGRSGTCGGGGITIVHPALGVKPKGATVSVTANLTATQTFTISNYQSTAQTYTLTLTCSGRAVSGCTGPTSTGSVPAGSSVSETYMYTSNDTVGTTGTIQLKASASGSSDSAAVTINVTGNLVVSTLFTNQEDQDYARCAAQCFAATASVGTAPHISRDVARGVTLVYNSDRVALRPTVYADVTLRSASDTVQTFQLQARVLGVMATFANGEQVLTFRGSPANHSSKPFRLAGVINVDQTLANPSTGIYQLQLVVTANYADHQEQVIDTTHTLSIVNTRGSHVARGWTIAGIPALYSYIHNNGHIDQFKYMVPTGDGSSVTYNMTNGCQPVCVPVLPAGVFSTISEQFDGQGHFQGFTRLYPDSAKEFYGFASPNGTLTSIIARTQADTVSFTYDAGISTPDTGVFPRVLTISDPQRMFNGHHAVITLHYDSITGLLSRIVEPGPDGAPDSGRVTKLTVDNSGLLRVWKDVGTGDSTRFGYDALQRLDSIVDPSGNVTTYTYEPVASKVIAITSPPVPIDANASGATAMQPLVTTFRPWQLVGVPTGGTGQVSGSPATPVEADTIEAVVTDPDGAITRFTVDQWGQPLVTHVPLGLVTTDAKDANGFVTFHTRPNGAVDQFAHSGPFLIKSFPANQPDVDYTYGAFGQLTMVSSSFTSSGIPTETFALGVRGHRDSTMIAGKTVARYFADQLGRDTAYIDALGNKTRYTYDPATGNLATTTETLGGRRQTKTFDADGRVHTITVSAPTGPTTIATTAYDSLNRVISVFDGVHAAPTTYTYTGLNLTQVSDPKAQVYTMTYNALGWPLTQTDPMNRTAATTYNTRGLPATVTNRSGQLVSYTYDSLGRVLQVKRPAVVTGEPDAVETWSYSPDGDTTIASNGVSTDASYQNRFAGLPDSTVSTFANGLAFKRSYIRDGFGRPTSITVSMRNAPLFNFYTRAYFYNPNTALLDSIALVSSGNVRNTVSMHYNAAFLPDTVRYPNSVTRANTYTDTHQLLSATWNLNQGIYRGYGYDSTGRVTEQDYGARSGNMEFFSYDAIGELTNRLVGRWTDTTVTCSNSQITGYGCGPQRQVTVTQADTFAFDSAGSLRRVAIAGADTVGTFLPGNRLAAWGALTFTGDSDGNRKSATAGSSTTQYTWGADGRLLQVTAASTTRRYDYNALGQLAQRTTNGTVDRYYVWDGSQLIGIVNASGPARLAEFAYFPGTDRPLARITGGFGTTTVHYIAQDGLGNVIGQFSGTTLEQTLAYEPWGAAAITTTTSDTTQLRWKGYLFEDGPTSLYYARARWYDPLTRRFLAPDPSGGAGINEFAFASGDPVNGSDPSGAVDDFCAEDVDLCTLEGVGGGGGSTGDPFQLLPPIQITAPWSYSPYAISDWVGFFDTGPLPVLGGPTPGPALGSGALAGPTNPPTVSHCLAVAAADKGVSIGLDILGAIPAVGNAVSVGSGLVRAGIAVNHAITSPVFAVGSGLYGAYGGVTAGPENATDALVGSASASAGIGLALADVSLGGTKAIPIVGNVVSVATLVWDGYQAYNTYRSCIAGH